MLLGEDNLADEDEKLSKEEISGFKLDDEEVTGLSPSKDPLLFGFGSFDRPNILANSEFDPMFLSLDAMK